MENRKLKFRSEHDYFFETFFLYFEDIRKFRYRVHNHPFSIIESRLLDAHVLYRKNQWQKALELLNSFTAHPMILEGVRMFLLGMTYNQQGAYHKGEPLLESSLAILEDIEFKRMPFYISAVLVTNLANQRKKDKVKQVVDKMYSYPIHLEFDIIKRYQAQLAYLLIFEKADEGIALIKKVMKDYKHSIGNQIPFYLTMYFMFSFQKKDYDECFEIMKRYKTYKGCKVKVNYVFEKTMLEHIVHDKPLYVYAKDFAEDTTLYKQALIGKHLSLGETKQAKEIWYKLREEFPQLYGEAFDYKGEWGLFAAVIDKHQGKANDDNIDLVELSRIKKIEDKILFILKNSSRPISKEDIIKYVWDELIDDKNSERLYKQMSRIRKKYPGMLMTSQGMYWVENAQKKGA